MPLSGSRHIRPSCSQFRCRSHFFFSSTERKSMCLFAMPERTEFSSDHNPACSSPWQPLLGVVALRCNDLNRQWHVPANFGEDEADDSVVFQDGCRDSGFLEYTIRWKDVGRLRGYGYFVFDHTGPVGFDVFSVLCAPVFSPRLVLHRGDGAAKEEGVGRVYVENYLAVVVGQQHWDWAKLKNGFELVNFFTISRKFFGDLLGSGRFVHLPYLRFLPPWRNHQRGGLLSLLRSSLKREDKP